MFAHHIHEQCIQQMAVAIDFLPDFEEDDGYLDGLMRKYGWIDEQIPTLSHRALPAVECLKNLRWPHYTFNDEIANAITTLWAEPAIKKMYEMRNITKIEDSSAYFWEKVEEIKAPQYVPNHMDMVMLRLKTTGLFMKCMHLNWTMNMFAH